MDDAGESGASEQTPPTIKAEDNPWYLLATLYGVPAEGDYELKAKNRAAWNRYFAANLDEETRAKLIEEKRHPAEELTPFSPDEWQEVATAFAERSKASATKPALPDSGADIDFSNVKFEEGDFFRGYLFTRDSRFQSATFSGNADFGGATFSCISLFSNATFLNWASFDGANFFVGASFDLATFSGGANFSGATFSGGVVFDGATFSGGAVFRDANFFVVASFDLATFSGVTYRDTADFGGATFFGPARFYFATFEETTSFVNAEMKRQTTFEGAIFKREPPKFFGAKLHQGTVWRGIKRWPTPKRADEAGVFVDAYACLKLEMDRLKKHEDELDFFALELQSRRIWLGRWGWGLPIWLYGVLSGYGRSYIRPLGALFVVVSIGAGVFSYFDARACWEALGLSAASTLNVFGLRRDFNMSIDTPLDWLKVFAAVQTILGAILLFLFGLGIRNKFRMK